MGVTSQGQSTPQTASYDAHRYNYILHIPVTKRAGSPNHLILLQDFAPGLCLIVIFSQMAKVIEVCLQRDKVRDVARRSEVEVQRSCSAAKEFGWFSTTPSKRHQTPGLRGAECVHMSIDD